MGRREAMRWLREHGWRDDPRSRNTLLYASFRAFVLHDCVSIRDGRPFQSPLQPIATLLYTPSLYLQLALVNRRLEEWNL